MEKRKIKYYFCGNEVIQEEGYDTSRKVRVNCSPKCGKYELTGGSIKFYFKRDNGKELLNQDDRKKLSAYVQENYDSVENKPVLINTTIIEDVTGKKSIHDS